MTSKAHTSAWSARRPLILGAIGVVILCGGFGYWAATAEISGAVIATGQVEVERNRQIIQHLDGGVVTEIDVDEGETVAEGDLLIRLDAAALTSELAILEAELFELQARRARLEAERDGSDSLRFDPAMPDTPEVRDLQEGQVRLFEARLETFDRQTEQLQKRLDQIADQVAGIEAQQTSVARQLELIEQELESQQSLLDRGLAQSARVLALEREQANLIGRAGELAAAKAQNEGRATEAEIEILRLATFRRETAITELRDIRVRELELAETVREQRRRLDRLDIRAPVSGVVYGLQVFAERSVIRPAEPLMFIVPQDRPLVITSQVPPTDIDQVFVGQDVTLRLSAFDQRRTPELMGTVTQVSADAFTDEATRQSYYRAEIILQEGEIDKIPDGLALIPGMPVESFIRTAARTPIEFVTRPLTDYFARAFRSG